jgi:acetoin utilization deacetylase AcuC-like enzyme
VAVWIYRDDRFLAHDPGAGHPEGARRLGRTLEDLDRRPVAGTRVVRPPPAPLEALRLVHDDAHRERMERTRDRPTRLDPDTTAGPGSYEAAVLAAGAAVDAAEKVVQGEASGAFALVRPPGHHALRDRAMGFCLFNNVAVAAAHAAREGGLSRILVLDPDVHHGNGTQDAFWTRSDVLYVSSHQWPYYPGTGAVDEIGEGDGRGFTVNLPLAEGSADADFLHVWERVVDPIVRAWEPQLILVSAGFDAWKDDPLAGLRVTERGFAAFYALVRRWADAHAPGRVVCALEGGYDPEGVRVGVRAALEELARDRPGPVEVEGAPGAAARAVAERARRVLSDRWPTLR